MSTNITAINFLMESFHNIFMEFNMFQFIIGKENKDPSAICLQVMIPWKEAQIIITELYYQKINEYDVSNWAIV